MVTCQTCHCHMAPDRAKDMSMTWSQRNHPGDSDSSNVEAMHLNQSQKQATVRRGASIWKGRHKSGVCSKQPGRAAGERPDKKKSETCS